MTKRARTPVVQPVQLPLLDRNATRVVNVRREPGWKKDRRFVFIGRRKGHDPRSIEPGQLGCFGNPYVVGPPPDRHPADEAMRLCESYLRERMRQERAFFLAVRSLKGRILGCYCVKDDGSGKCHGHIFLKLLGEIERGEWF